MDISPAAPTIMDSTPRPVHGGAAVDDDGFGFDDLLDVINPLQHVPIIGTIYRELTGDEIEAPARIAGGALFGGLFGLLGTLGTIAYEGIVGETVDETLVSLFKSDDAVRAEKAYAAAQDLIL